MTDIESGDYYEEYYCPRCGEHYDECVCPEEECTHDERVIGDYPDGLMAWECADCGERLSGWIGQFGILFPDKREANRP
jgi:predicted RNA-binding Zn-ribbon protein involved in translation (DUF1610 family)